MRTYAIFLVIVVLVFGILYAVLTPWDHGFFHNDENQISTLWYRNLLNGIYFSIVTISSLGYGDIHPVGFSKFLTSLEVLIGVAILGIIIAKLTSRKIAFRISRLSRSNIEAYLETRARKISDQADSLNTILEGVGVRYASTPGGGGTNGNVGNKAGGNRGGESEEIRKFSSCLDELGVQYKMLREYFSEEIESGDFFQIAPKRSLLHVADAAEEAVFDLMQLLIALPTSPKSKWLLPRNRSRISGIAKDLEYVCGIMERPSAGLHSEQSVTKLRHVCENLTRSYYHVPVHPDNMQPSQVPPGDGTEPSVAESDFVGGLAAQ